MTDREAASAASPDDIQALIQNMIDSEDVVLFMKGTQDFPQCGFSGIVVQILKHLAVPFLAVNVLEDDRVREGVKQFANWPTIPQLYVKGEFLGGSDIIREMFQEGELHTTLQEKGIAASAPGAGAAG